MDEMSRIGSLVGALAVHIDARRWGPLTDLFSAEVRVDYSSLFGGESEVMAREDLMGRWRKLLPGFTSTTHLIGTPNVMVVETQAEVSASVVAWHFIKDQALKGIDLWLVGGCYEISCERQNDGQWRIASLTLARAWAEGNSELPRLAGERAAEISGV